MCPTRLSVESSMRILFILNEFSLHNHVVERCVVERPDDRISVVKVPLVLKGRSRADTAARILPKLSRRFIFWKLQEFVVVAALTFVPKLLGRGAVFRRLRSIAWRYQLPYYRSDDVMSPATLAFVREQAPDLIITLMHQIVKDELIAIPRLGVVNIHPGILPEFRGIQPYFWELMSGYGAAGPSLHYIRDASIDTGELLAYARYRTWPGMSVQLNYYLTARCAAQLLPELVDALNAGCVAPVPQDTTRGEYYRWPDSASVDRLRTRGHPLVSARDLWGILSGRFDSFQAEVSEVMRKDLE